MCPIELRTNFLRLSVINLRTSDQVDKWISELHTIGNKVSFLYSLIQKKKKFSIYLASKFVLKIHAQ